jgi:hypothetical protein
MSIIYVKKDGSGDATTIQQGIQLAAVGDTVQVEAGVFDQNIDLYKGITLKGAGKDQTIITGKVRNAITARAFIFVTGQSTLSLTQTAIDSGFTTVDYEVGRIVTASGIPANTRIVSKTPTSLTLSANVTSAAASRTIAMGLQNEGTIRVRSTDGVIQGLKVIGFDLASPSVEIAAIYFKNTGLGSSAAYNWELTDCEVVADGEYAVLTDFAVGVGNLNIHHNIISGKTFTGNNPAFGNQFTVPNVPRQLVVIQGVNSGLNKFEYNEIVASTGGYTIDGVQSFNTACTIDAVGSVVTNNSFIGDYGYGYTIRARGLNAVVDFNDSIGTSNGFYILPNHAVNVEVKTGTMLFNSNKYWICIQDHMSSSTNAPLGAVGSEFWEEITLEQVNSSNFFGVNLLSVGTNNAIIEFLAFTTQEEAGEPVTVSLGKNLLKLVPAIADDPVFSDESNWKIAGLVYKKDSKRLVSAFTGNFEGVNQMNLRDGVSGELFELHKIIISLSDRTLKVLKRSQINNVSSFDITLK